MLILLLIVLWLLSGATAWWIIVRHVFKRLTIHDLILGIPICLVGGPIVFCFAAPALPGPLFDIYSEKDIKRWD